MALMSLESLEFLGPQSKDTSLRFKTTIEIVREIDGLWENNWENLPAETVEKETADNTWKQGDGEFLDDYKEFL
jgi:hypothetical protein